MHLRQRRSRTLKRFNGWVRRKPLAFGLTLATVVGIGLPVVTSTLPAQAINCSYGDNFYFMFSQYTNDNFYESGYKAAVSDKPEHHASTRTARSSPARGARTPPALRGRSGCRRAPTCASTDNNDNSIYMLTCNNLASQQWVLYDQQALLSGEELWGGLLNWRHASSGATTRCSTFCPVTHWL